MQHQSRPEGTITGRKDDHIRINLEEDVRFRSLRTGLDELPFEHQALPEHYQFLLSKKLPLSVQW